MSWRYPGSVRSSVAMNPPISALRSRRITDQLARANSAAETRPLMPLPTTIASASSVISSSRPKVSTEGESAGPVCGVRARRLVLGSGFCGAAILIHHGGRRHALAGHQREDRADGVSNRHKGTLPDYALYVPDVQHDGHDSGVSAADRWLSETFGPLLSDARFTENMVFIVTFDEGRGWWRRNHIYTVLYGERVIPGSVSDSRYDHYDLLRTIEDIFALGTLRQHDSKASTITSIWKGNSS